MESRAIDDICSDHYTGQQARAVEFELELGGEYMDMDRVGEVMPVECRVVGEDDVAFALRRTGGRSGGEGEPTGSAPSSVSAMDNKMVLVTTRRGRWII
jgi:hypothetical protein